MAHTENQINYLTWYLLNKAYNSVHLALEEEYEFYAHTEEARGYFHAYYQDMVVCVNFTADVKCSVYEDVYGIQIELNHTNNYQFELADIDGDEPDPNDCVFDVAEHHDALEAALDLLMDNIEIDIDLEPAFEAAAESEAERKLDEKRYGMA